MDILGWIFGILFTLGIIAHAIASMKSPDGGASDAIWMMMSTDDHYHWF